MYVFWTHYVSFRKWIWKNNCWKSYEWVTTVRDIQTKVCLAKPFCGVVMTKRFLMSIMFVSRNNLVWLHTVFAVLYLILTVLLLRRHTSQIKGMRRETVSLWLLQDLSFKLWASAFSLNVSHQSLNLNCITYCSCLWWTRADVHLCSYLTDLFLCLMFVGQKHSVCVFSPSISNWRSCNDPFQVSRLQIKIHFSYCGLNVVYLHVIMNSCHLLHVSVSALFLCREAYPSCQVCAVNLGYDVAKLMYLDKERWEVKSNHNYKAMWLLPSVQISACHACESKKPPIVHNSLAQLFAHSTFFLS